ncbi:MAG: sigma-70 family RNA polymerase sigma factor [Fimbriimonadaceae bacterium]|nr:sigma-70 family RNA polymerase sigma factor [Fimbriimonadaceae bacterium]
MQPPATPREVELRRAEFERLLQPLLKSLYNTALGYVRNPADAEDAVQDTVLRAYRAFGGFQPGTNFKAWLFRILTNYCINRFRRSERAVDAIAYEDVEREAELAGARLLTAADTPEPAIFDDLLDEEVEAAIASLPLEFRIVVVLSDLQDYTYQEIADIAQVPIGTVRSRLFRGRRLLRQALEQYARERGYLREMDGE